MGRRNYKRFQVEVPVTVSGLDTAGNPFSQSATTVEISARGVRLREISCLSGRRGEPVHVKYKGHTALYRVAWMGNDGTTSQGLVGLESVEHEECVFAERLPIDFACGFDPRMDNYVVREVDEPALAVDAFAVSPEIAARCKADRRTEERRHNARFSCTGTARIREQGQELAINARLNEISLGGCYIEIMAPLRMGACVRLEMRVNQRNISVEGVVRNSLSNFGMGVEFMKISPAEAQKLQRVVAELSGAVPPEMPAPPPVRIPETLEEAVNQWFGSHEQLTRLQFQELKDKVTHLAKDLTPTF
jgi:c-di-GMP-binding flagellar brake protein YcgR